MGHGNCENITRHGSNVFGHILYCDGHVKGTPPINKTWGTTGDYGWYKTNRAPGDYWLRGGLGQLSIGKNYWPDFPYFK